MEATPRPPQRWPGSDIVFEARRRLEVYSADWRDGFRVRARILAPSTYIFLASLLPALAFGLQLDSDTEGVLGVVQVLAATAITGVVQAVVGGQPLLIVGVAEPVVLIYGFMYDWAEGQQGLGRGRFLAWAAWVCVWTAVMVLLLAASGACRWVGAFTRFSGELFGGLIGVLFLQQAIKGLIAQFRLDPNASHSGEESAAADAYVWRLVNGLWSLLLAAGLLLGALAVVRARSWRFLSKPLRGLLADYGAPACVLVCTGVSFAVSPQAHGAAPPGVPRRVSTGDVWSGSSIDGSSSSSGWRVAARMGEVPGTYIAAALLPAFVIAVLFYFDHSVSSLMAQQPEYRLARPPAFALDLALLAAMTLGCGLMGLPPVNGVLPQAPMHTRSLATLGTRGVKGAAGRQPGPAADEDEVERRHSSGVEPAAAPTANGNSNSAVNGVVNGAITAAMHFPTAAVELAAASARLRPRRHPPAAAPAAVAASGGGGGGVGSVGGVITDVAAGGVRQPSTRVDGPHLGPPPGAALPAALASRPPSHLAQQPSPPAASAAAALRPQRLGSSGSGQGGQGAACAGQAGCRLGWQGAAGEGAEGGDGGAGDAGQPAAAAARRRLLNGRTSTEDAAAEQEAYRGEAAVGRGNPAAEMPHGTEGICRGSTSAPPSLLPRLQQQQQQQQQPPGVPPARGTALPLCVLEQRLSGLLQSLGVAACLFATPAIRQIPQAALWGYFAFMAVESFQGSQLVDRVLLLLTDPARRPALAAAGPHAPYLETVPFAVTAAFTGLQVLLLAGVWALVTWAGVAGVAFPLPIMALVPLRAFVLPRLFRPEHLRELDAAEYEQVPPAPPPPALPPPALLGSLSPPLSPLGSTASAPGRPGAAAELGQPTDEVPGLGGLLAGGGGAPLSPTGGAAAMVAAGTQPAVEVEAGEGAGAGAGAGGGLEPLVAVVVSGSGSGRGRQLQPHTDVLATAGSGDAAGGGATAAAGALDWEAERGLIESEHVGVQPVHHLTRSQLRQRMAAGAPAGVEAGVGATGQHAGG